MQSNIDVGMVELVPLDRARRFGLDRFMRVSGVSDVTVRSNYFNGVSLPEGIVFRMQIPPD